MAHEPTRKIVTLFALAVQSQRGAFGKNETGTLDKSDFQCEVFAEFSQSKGSCCNLNLDCRSICCLAKICVVKEPCPNYDGSIERWEAEQFNRAIDE